MEKLVGCLCYWQDVAIEDPLHTDILYNDKTHYSDNSNGTNPWLKTRRIIVDIQEYCILYSKKHMLRMFVKIP